MVPGVVPVVLPHVIATVGDESRLTVAIDGVAITQEPVGEAAFGALLDEILRERATPVRVELIEADGTTYTDILTPPPPSPPVVASTEQTTDTDNTNAATKQAGPRLVEVTGDGFVPGEDVALAVIVRHSSATAAGLARHLVADHEAAPGCEVVLVGRISGTLHIEHLR